jgi:hypothetical protein
MGIWTYTSQKHSSFVKFHYKNGEVVCRMAKEINLEIKEKPIFRKTLKCSGTYEKFNRGLRFICNES